MADQQLWLLVGGNGAGKSTFYHLALEPLGLPFVNADRLARLVYPEAPEAHSYAAAQLAEQQRNSLLLSGASFCFETVYSHPSKIDFAARAKALGYVEDAKKVDAKANPNYKPGQICGNCLQWADKNRKAPLAKCNLFPGKQVKNTGWCKVWVKAPGT